MRKTSLFVFFLSALALFAAGALTNRSQARELAPACPDDGVASIAECPDTGCGDNGDALLNRAKNLVPTITTTVVKTLDSIREMAQPTRWNTGASRTSITGPGKEGTAVEVKGFVLAVKPQGGESCNCELTHRDQTDVHFALVDDLEEDETTSITAEVTPRVRDAGHPNWVYKNLKDLEGEYVKVVGMLMLDTKHISQTARLEGERRNKGLKRATNWEVHPITAIWRCTRSKRSCDRGNGWEAVE